MPIRDYRCEKCGEKWEVITSAFSEEYPIHCEKCNVPATKEQTGYASTYYIYGNNDASTRPKGARYTKK